jgi:hypothetical protein
MNVYPLDQVIKDQLNKDQEPIIIKDTRRQSIPTTDFTSKTKNQP